MSAIAVKVKVGLVLFMAVALGAVSSVAVASANSLPKKSSPLTFDVLAEFSGPNAFVGETFIYPGAAAAAEEINQHGGILGHPLNLVKTDQGADPADTPPAVNQMLVKNPGLTAVIGIGSGVAPTVAPILNARHIAVMSPAGSAALDFRTYPYFWRVTQPDSLSGGGWATTVYDRGYHRIALIVDNSAGSQSDAGPFVTTFKKLGGKILLDQTIVPDQSSYSTVVAQMASLHPQALATEEDPQTAATLFANMYQLGDWNIPVINGPSNDTAQYPEAAEAATGSWPLADKYFYEAHSAFASTPGFGALDQAFRKVFPKGVGGSRVPNPGNRINYDGVIILALAMTAAHSTSPSVFINYINKVTGTTGTKVTDYAQGVAALKKGEKIYYDGAEGVYSYNKFNWPSEPFTMFGITGTQGALHPVETISAAALSKQFIGKHK